MRPSPGAPVELQATVVEPGEVVLDDGRRLTHSLQAVSPQVRRLSPGQRVRLRLDAGRVTALTLAGLPLPPDDLPPAPPAAGPPGGG